jgi:hypothetical protein
MTDMTGILCSLCWRRVKALTYANVCAKCEARGGESKMHGVDGRPLERVIHEFNHSRRRINATQEAV